MINIGFMHGKLGVVNTVWSLALAIQREVAAAMKGDINEIKL